MEQNIFLTRMNCHAYKLCNFLLHFHLLNIERYIQFLRIILYNYG